MHQSAPHPAEFLCGNNHLRREAIVGYECIPRLFVGHIQAKRRFSAGANGVGDGGAHSMTRSEPSPRTFLPACYR